MRNNPKSEGLFNLIKAVLALAGGVAVLYVSILNIIRPPMVFQWAVDVFHFAIIVCVVSASIILVSQHSKYAKLHFILAPIACLALLTSLAVFGLFSHYNLQSDWSEAPSVLDTTVSKGVVESGEVVDFQARVKNPNEVPLDIKWTAHAGKWLDDKGTSAKWKAPVKPGMYSVALQLRAEKPVDETIEIEVIGSSSLEEAVEFFSTTSALNDFCVSAFQDANFGATRSRESAEGTIKWLCDGASYSEQTLIRLSKADLDVRIAQIARNVSLEQIRSEIQSKITPSGPQSKTASLIFPQADPRPCCRQELGLVWPFCKIFDPTCR